MTKTIQISDENFQKLVRLKYDTNSKDYNEIINAFFKMLEKRGGRYELG